MTELNKTIEPANKKPKHVFRSFFKILLVLIIIGVLGTLCFLASLSIKHQIYSLKEENSALQKLVAQQKEAFTALEQNVTNISKAISEPDKTWKQEELKFIIHSAYLQLHVYHDVAGTINLLEMADRLVQDSTNQAEIDIHHKLVEKITVLKTTPQTDLSATYIKLQTLGDQIEKLPLISQPIPITTKPSTESSDTTTAGKLKNIFYDIFKKIFIIRKYPYPVQPLPSPEELKVININVRLLITEAEWALLKRQSIIYTATLDQIAKIIQTSFAATKEQETILQEINSLKAVKLDLTMPPLDNILPSS